MLQEENLCSSQEEQEAGLPCQVKLVLALILVFHLVLVLILVFHLVLVLVSVWNLSSIFVFAMP